MDIIYLRAIELSCVIGVNEWERHVKQKVTVDVELELDLRKAGREDVLSLTADYKHVRDLIEDAVGKSKYHLIEALAEHVASVCLEDHKVQGVHVRVEKPGALRNVRTAGVKISRRRE